MSGQTWQEMIDERDARIAELEAERDYYKAVHDALLPTTRAEIIEALPDTEGPDVTVPIAEASATAPPRTIDHWPDAEAPKLVHHPDCPEDGSRWCHEHCPVPDTEGEQDG